MSKSLLSTFGDNLTVAVIGASGGLGQAIVRHLIGQAQVTSLYAFSRSGQSYSDPKVTVCKIDVRSEDTIEEALGSINNDVTFDIVIVATGLLYNESVSPEKSMKDLNMDQLTAVFTVNTFGPALVAKHFLNRMQRYRKSVFACLSARVGSISDNRLGGWYAYRSSKAALNMILKNLAIEMARKNKNISVIGLHPGTVRTKLSKPYHKNVTSDQLFTPDYASQCLLEVINNTTADQSGMVFAWDGSEVSA